MAVSRQIKIISIFKIQNTYFLFITKIHQNTSRLLKLSKIKMLHNIYSNFINESLDA